MVSSRLPSISHPIRHHKHFAIALFNSACSLCAPVKDTAQPLRKRRRPHFRCAGPSQQNPLAAALLSSGPAPGVVAVVAWARIRGAGRCRCWSFCKKRLFLGWRVWRRGAGFVPGSHGCFVRHRHRFFSLLRDDAVGMVQKRGCHCDRERTMRRGIIICLPTDCCEAPLLTPLHRTGRQSGVVAAVNEPSKRPRVLWPKTLEPEVE